MERARRNDDANDLTSPSTAGAIAPGKRTRVQMRYGGGGGQPAASSSAAAASTAAASTVQLFASATPAPPDSFAESLAAGDPAAMPGVPAVESSAATTAAAGVSSASSALPFLTTIQGSFGDAHDLSGVRAEVGGAATGACQSLGAEAYATGDRVGFARAPDLWTSAHEAAHVVQQAGGVHLASEVGEAGDAYERHADAVADRVVAGGSAADLLASCPTGPSDGARHVQLAPKSGASATADATVDATATGPDTAWAGKRQAEVRRARALLAKTRGALVAEARLSVGVLGATREVFAAYEERHAAAAATFETKVAAHLEAAQDFRDSASFVFDLVLGAGPLKLIMSVVSAVTSALETVEKVTKLASYESADRRKDPDRGPPTDAPDVANVDWKLLVDGSLMMFDTFVDMTDSIGTLDTAYDTVNDELSEVLAGTSSATTGSALDLRAAALAGVSLPASTGAYGPALKLLLATSTKLGTMSQTDIEREMGIHWIAELSDSQLSAIRKAEPYLTKLGVVGPRSGNALGIDPTQGLELSNHEEKLVAIRARVLVAAKGAIGTSVPWLGGRKQFGLINGRVSVDGHRYNAHGPAEPGGAKCYDVGHYLPEGAGGTVRIVGAEFVDLGVEVTSDWSTPSEQTYTAAARSQIRFEVEATPESIADPDAERDYGLVDPIDTHPSMSAAR